VSGTSEHREIEFKFRIPTSTSIDLPELLASTSSMFAVEEHRSMDATYYDTPSLTLIRWGITLRHREGGGDDGWHMKLPASTADLNGTPVGRDEVHAEGNSRLIPSELISIASPLLRRQEIVPVARVRTERSPYRVQDDHGTDLVEVVDDRVEVTRLDDPGVEADSFHEVEVELLVDSKAAWREVDTISTALRKFGASPNTLSKAAQALGRRAGDPPDVPAVPYPHADKPAVDALQAIFASYVRELLTSDVGVRRGVEDSVHSMRVACRRLRSALKTFEPILDPESVSFLRSELSWMATELGGISDTEVQAVRLSGMAQDQAVSDFLTTALESRRRATMSSAMAALRSDRHDFLIEDLIILVSEPPVLADGFAPAHKVLRACVRRPWRKLDSAVKRTDAGSPEETWHRIRILAKQARYSAEAVAPILGPGYARLAKHLARATDTLGERHDAAVSAQWLRELAESAPPPISFRLGMMAASCADEGRNYQRDFSRRWPTISARAQSLGLD